MCLQIVDKKPKVRKGEGWKVFQIGPRGGLRNAIQKEGRALPKNRSLRSNGVFITSGSDGESRPYPSGFHILRTRAEAREYRRVLHCLTGRSFVVHKVKFDEVTATGTGGLFQQFEKILTIDCIVARRMRILEEAR